MAGEDVKQLQKHSEYYILGGDLHLMAKNEDGKYYLFRVNSFFLCRESRKFSDRYLVGSPSPGTTKSEAGTSDSNAIILDIPAESFEAFLWVFYNPKYSIYDGSIEIWKRIMTLARDWDFPEVMSLAIREVEKLQLDVIERITMYQEFKVGLDYLVPLYAELCARENPLTDDEAERLGLKTTVLVFKARESLRSPIDTEGDEPKSPLPKEIGKDEVVQRLGRMMGLPSPTSPTKGKQKQGGANVDVSKNSKGKLELKLNSNGRTSPFDVRNVRK